MDPVSLHNFAVVSVVANCAMGLFREIIASLINEFVPSFPTQLPSRRCRGGLHYETVWRRYYFFDRPFPHLPWVPETFLARFPVSVWLRPTTEDVSAFGQHRKFPPYARKTSVQSSLPKTATSPQKPLSPVPTVTVVERFDCTVDSLLTDTSIRRTPL